MKDVFNVPLFKPFFFENAYNFGEPPFQKVKSEYVKFIDQQPTNSLEMPLLTKYRLTTYLCSFVTLENLWESKFCN
jgi:hypothetical protein